MSFYSAHNGNKFDFPLLMKEIKRTGASLQTEVLCVDTWVGCKHLLTMRSQLPEFRQTN